MKTMRSFSALGPWPLALSYLALASCAPLAPADPMAGLAPLAWQTLGTNGKPYRYALGDYSALYRVCQCSTYRDGHRACRCTEPTGEMMPAADAPQVPQIQRATAAPADEFATPKPRPRMAWEPSP